ncbi:MAG: PAS domain-containing protein [Chitinophagaceae bacterium]|nr:PAS domain-containing protein [Chitinophagaceae bacterium]
MKEVLLNFFNPEAALKLGYSPEELIDKETPVLFHSKLEIDKKRNELKKQLGITIANDFNVIVEKARRNLHEEQQFTYIKKDSTTFPVSLTVTAIKNVNETVTGF